MDQTVGHFLDRLDKVPIMSVMLFVTLTAFIVILGYLQFKRDQLDLRWLLLDDKTTKPSIHKIGQLLALMVSTWGFIYQMTHDKFTTEYLTIYMTIWAGAGAVNKFLDAKQPPGTTTYETTTKVEQTTADTQPQEGPK